MFTATTAKGFYKTPARMFTALGPSEPSSSAWWEADYLLLVIGKHISQK